MVSFIQCRVSVSVVFVVCLGMYGDGKKRAGHVTVYLLYLVPVPV